MFHNNYSFIIFILIIFIIFFIIIFKIPDFIYKLECSLLFHPTKLYKDYDFGLKEQEKYFQETINKKITIKEIEIKNGSNVIDTILFKNPSTKYTIIFAHGNGGNMCNLFHVAHKMLPIASIILFDYRGYGKSDGVPNEEGIYDDILNVWKY